MKFYILEAMTTSQGEAIEHRPYEEKNDAFMNFYQVMASAYANADVTEGVCFILNNKGGVEMTAVVDKTEPEPVEES